MKIYLIFSVFTLFLYFYINDSYGIDEIQNYDKKLVNILLNYWNWWNNSPEDNPDNDPKCSIHIDTKNNIAFLQNSFETDNTSYDCIENPIPKGYFILIPLITSFCSQGDVGLYNKPFNEIRECTLNLDRGQINGKIFVDGKKIVDIFIDNGNGIDGKKNVVNNLPQENNYYKEIFSEEFVDILVTNKTVIPNNWENDDYKKNIIHYNGIIHCDCIIINTNQFDIGDHGLEYTISSKADPPSPLLSSDKWTFTSNTKYALSIQ